MKIRFFSVEADYHWQDCRVEKILAMKKFDAGYFYFDEGGLAPEPGAKTMETTIHNIYQVQFYAVFHLTENEFYQGQQKEFYGVVSDKEGFEWRLKTQAGPLLNYLKYLENCKFLDLEAFSMLEYMKNHDADILYPAVLLSEPNSNPYDPDEEGEEFPL